LTIRNVPEQVKDRLAGQAKADGRSLEGYLRVLLAKTADTPGTVPRRDLAAEIGAVMRDAGAFLEEYDVPGRDELPRDVSLP
jgi:plasmid stability protein